MQNIIDFLNEPIVLTLVTILIGSYLVSVIADRRARKNKLRDEAIQFLGEAGDHINQIFPLIYRNLRTGAIEVDPLIEDGLTNLFSKRMSIQVGSQAFLHSELFYKQYFRLLDLIALVIVSMSGFQTADREQALAQIRKNRLQLSEDWPVVEEALFLEPLEPIDEYIAWMDMVMLRTTQLLSSHLDEAMQ
jgi:hypothetical protein